MSKDTPLMDEQRFQFLISNLDGTSQSGGFNYWTVDATGITYLAKEVNGEYRQVAVFDYNTGAGQTYTKTNGNQELPCWDVHNPC